MLNSNESKNIEKTKKNEEDFNRRVNTEREKQKEKENKRKEREKKLLSVGDRYKYYFPMRFEKICNKKCIKGVNAQSELGISESTFSKYINGKAVPSFEVLSVISEKLNVSPYYLMGVTDNMADIPLKNNMEIGLSEQARYYLYILAHNLHADVPDNDVQNVIWDLSYSEENIKFLEIFSLFISDFSNFCEFLTYIRRYVVVKQEINEFKTNDFNKLERIALEDTLIRN